MTQKVIAYETPSIRLLSLNYENYKLEKIMSAGEETASACSGRCCYKDGKSGW